jgi:hypothetical protein
MNKKASSQLLAACLLASSACFAELNAADQSYVDRLIKGGPSTLREVSESMYNASVTNPEVLDIAAEVLLEKYPLAGDQRDTVDAAAWLCRALGNSGNNRYKAVLEKVGDDKSVHRRLRGYCEKAAKPLAKGATNSYLAGTVNLELLRNPPPPPPPPPATVAKGKTKGKPATGKPAAAAAPVAAATAAAAPAAAPAAATAPKTVDFSLIKVGMSQQEVTDLLGPPTNQSQRMTGKQWQPFNFGARDLQRMMFLYKGVGRVEFSLKSAYEGVFRVITVTPNPNESGYP